MSYPVLLPAFSPLRTKDIRAASLEPLQLVAALDFGNLMSAYSLSSPEALVF